MNVNIHRGRTHNWEVRSESGECLLATDFFSKATGFIDANGHQLLQGTTEQSVLPAWTKPPVDKYIPDQEVFDAMALYGGGFVSALSVAWRRADGINCARLSTAFPDIWEQYYKMAAEDRSRRQSKPTDRDRQAVADEASFG
jgi:hypothetical protein